VKPKPDLNHALGLLVQSLRLDPSRPRALLDRIRRGDLGKEARSIAFLALQLTGGAAAGKVLRTAATDAQLHLADRLCAVQAYARAVDPGSETVDTDRKSVV